MEDAFIKVDAYFPINGYSNNVEHLVNPEVH